ncbi:MAG: hypothetical protein L0Z62_40055 [Gemmataceae bacterium]|nr:hypothetical protein [Gemmataceae bacterium]
MRALCWGFLGAGFLVLTAALRADDQADTKAVLDKALQAMGGAEKLAKFSVGTVKCRITHERNGQQALVAAEGTWRGLDKIRFEGEITVGGQNRKILLVINGDMGWEKKGDQGRDAPEGLVAALKKAFYALQMPHLLPQLKNPAFTLAIQGEQKVENKEVVALSIGHTNHQEVSVLFDKETGLPLKSQTQINDPNGKEITVEFFYSDFQEVNGVKHPMKITLTADGNEFVIEISEIQAKDQVDDSAFAQP